MGQTNRATLGHALSDSFVASRVDESQYEFIFEHLGQSRLYGLYNGRAYQRASSLRWFRQLRTAVAWWSARVRVLCLGFVRVLRRGLRRSSSLSYHLRAEFNMTDFMWMPTDKAITSEGMHFSAEVRQL